MNKKAESTETSQVPSLRNANIQIAKLMGFYESPYPNTPNKMYFTSDDGTVFGKDISQIDYHKSWESLHQVIDAILAIDVKDPKYTAVQALGINKCQASIRGLGISTPFATAYNHVVAACIWINDMEPPRTVELTTFAPGRDPVKCQNCGKHKSLHIHFKICPIKP